MQNPKHPKALAAFLFFLATLSSALAQSGAEWKKRGDAFDGKGDPTKALAAYQKALDQDPNNAAILVKIAKQYGDMMPSLKGRARKKAGQQSLEFSKKALAASPKSSDSHLAVAISLGKNTEFMSTKEKLNASREMKAYAETALRLDPRSDYAHHLLGRWHQEIAGIGGASRAIAKVIYGGIPKGSYDAALTHFQKARSLRGRVIHQIEYGRTLAMMGRDAEAKVEIEKGLAMPSRDADDPDAKERGKKTLRKL